SGSRHPWGHGDHWIRSHGRRGGAPPEAADPGLAGWGARREGRVRFRGEPAPGLRPCPGSCGVVRDPARSCGVGQDRPFLLRKSLATVSASFLSTTTCLSRSDRVAVSSLADTALRAPSMVGLLLLLVISGTTFCAA